VHGWITAFRGLEFWDECGSISPVSKTEALVQRAKEMWELIHSVDKPKIPRQYAYVLKTSQLEELLVNKSIDIYVDLHYWLPQIIGSVFEAHYWMSNDNVPYDRLYIRAGALNSEDVCMARQLMLKFVLPIFASETKKILALPDNSTALKHGEYFVAVYKENTVYINSIPYAL
jgi:hypothetical protein